MRSKQRGITLMGLLIGLVLVGGWIYVGIRLTPVYLQGMAVKSALNKVRDEYESNPGTNVQMIRVAISRQFDVESITAITFKDIEITQEGGSFMVRAAYEDVRPLVANVSLLVDFDETVEIQAR
jgi:Domain of unknown function (DUF4845)